MRSEACSPFEEDNIGKRATELGAAGLKATS